MPLIGHSSERASRPRIGATLHRLPKKSTVDAVGKMLVDQDRDVRAAIRGGLDPGGRIDAGVDIGSDVLRAGAGDRIGDGAVTLRAHKGRDVHAVCPRDQRGQLPVRQVGGEDERRLAVEATALEVLERRFVHDDPSTRALSRPGAADAIELRQLRSEPAQIVPHAAQDAFDLGRTLFRKCRREIFAPDAMLGNERTDRAQGCGGNRRRWPRREPSHERKSEIDSEAGDRGASLRSPVLFLDHLDGGIGGEHPADQFADEWVIRVLPVLAQSGAPIVIGRERDLPGRASVHGAAPAQGGYLPDGADRSHLVQPDAGDLGVCQPSRRS